MSDIPNPIPSSIPVPTLAPTDSSESRFQVRERRTGERVFKCCQVWDSFSTFQIFLQVEQAWIRKKVHKSTHAREYNDTTFIEDDRNTWER